MIKEIILQEPIIMNLNAPKSSLKVYKKYVFLFFCLFKES